MYEEFWMKDSIFWHCQCQGLLNVTKCTYSLFFFWIFRKSQSSSSLQKRIYIHDIWHTGEIIYYKEMKEASQEMTRLQSEVGQDSWH